MSGRLDQADLADAIADALDGATVAGAMFLAGHDPDDERVVIVEVLHPDREETEAFLVRVTKMRSPKPEEKR